MSAVRHYWGFSPRLSWVREEYEYDLRCDDGEVSQERRDLFAPEIRACVADPDPWVRDVNITALHERPAQEGL